MGTSERWLALAAGLAFLGGCGPDPTPAAQGKKECVPVIDENNEKTGHCLPVAPKERRVDTGTPRFANPTEVTNPLHPTSEIAQTVYGGQVSGKPFRTEVTLLPDVKTITWQGQQIKAVTSQYFALSDGRIQEVALDWYAQADDGSVWYLGEDVFNYENGTVADTHGTWIAGTDAPAAMIMPAHPKPGDVYRPENLPGVVFEEVAVKAVKPDRIVVTELHMDGTREDKTFAHGYGEYSTGTPEGDLEQAMLALPTDAVPTPRPSTLDTLAAAIRDTATAISAGDWPAAATRATAASAAWAATRPQQMPLYVTQMDRDVETLTTAITAKDEPAARNAALRTAQNELDLRSRHQPVPDTDKARFALWARQLDLDAKAGDAGSVAGDLECLNWTLDRIRHELPNAGAVDAALTTLDATLGKGDLTSAAAQAKALAQAVLS